MQARISVSSKLSRCLGVEVLVNRVVIFLARLRQLIHISWRIDLVLALNQSIVLANTICAIEFEAAILLRHRKGHQACNTLVSTLLIAACLAMIRNGLENA